MRKLETLGRRPDRTIEIKDKITWVTVGTERAAGRKNRIYQSCTTMAKDEKTLVGQ